MGKHKADQGFPMSHLQGRTSSNGLIHAMDPQSARRQLHMSLGLLGALALAAGAGLSLQPAPLHLRQARLTVQTPQMVHVKHAQNMRRE